jgi:hypothetical protein
MVLGLLSASHAAAATQPLESSFKIRGSNDYVISGLGQSAYYRRRRLAVG